MSVESLLMRITVTQRLLNDSLDDLWHRNNNTLHHHTEIESLGTFFLTKNLETIVRESFKFNKRIQYSVITTLNT